MHYLIEHSHNTVTARCGTERITATLRPGGIDASFGTEKISFQRRRGNAYEVTGVLEGTAVLIPKRAKLFAAPAAERMDVHVRDIELSVVQTERWRFSAAMNRTPIGEIALYHQAELRASTTAAALVLLCALAMEHYADTDLL